MHVELLAHVRNPIGVKLGPTTSIDMRRLVDRLNPEGEGHDLYHAYGGG